jgi:hypothetical protein
MEFLRSAFRYVFGDIHQSSDMYEYMNLPTENSFRVLELLPGREHDPISCHLLPADWSNVPSYEAVSYAWGNPELTAPVLCHGKRVNVTQNLHNALTQLRHQDQSRLLWADALW